MPSFDKIRGYSQSVLSQIRWGKAHSSIAEEIEDHLAEQRDAYIEAGMNEAEATDQAIRQMGDPVIIGAGLDRVHRPKAQWKMIFLAVILLLSGFLIRNYLLEDATQPLLLPQLFFIILGLSLMMAAYLSDFSLIGKYPKTIYIAILALSVISMILSPYINGRSFYTYYVPLLFPLGFAAIVYNARNKGYLGISLVFICYLFSSSITLLIPAISGFLLFTVSGLALIITAIKRGWFNINRTHAYVLSFLTFSFTYLIILISIYNNNYQLARLKILFDPSSDPQGAGYVPTVIRALLSGANLFGRGDMPINYSGTGFLLPSISTDYILTYLIFHVGWIAFIVIMGLLLFFIVRGFILCYRQKSFLGLFVSLSVMLTFTMQVVIYVINNLGLPLSAPISLPLISYGKTATMFNLALIGLMLSVFRSGEAYHDKETPIHESNKFISWDNGKLIISFSKK